MSETRTERLTKQLLADRGRIAVTSAVIECFSCGRGMVYRGPRTDGTSGRFCSDRCRDWFDDGNPSYKANDPIGFDPFTTKMVRIAGPDPGFLPSPMPKGGNGFYRQCPGCNRQFESKGLRCCSTDCERLERERAENAKIMADAGMEPPAKRRCQQCGATIPRWRKGRQVSKRVKFCSERCGQRARSGTKGQNPA